MKKTFFVILCLGFSIFSYSQDNYFKYNGSTDVLFRYLPNGSGGRAIVHEANNTLVLNHSGGFTGGTEIQSNLRVTEMVKAKRLFLETTSVTSGWGMTNLEYGGHTLRIGSPKGYSTHNVLELVPGTNANDLRFTVLKLCTSNTLDVYNTVIELNTSGNSYINGGNVGIGTTSPQNKLEVAGTIKSKDQIIVGERVSSDPGETNRIVITPYRHTGGAWNIISRDQVNEAFLDFSYSSFNALTFKYFYKDTFVGIGTKDPKNKLDVAGTIRATEVKVEALPWADFVFDKDYKLPTLQEVENHINEYKHLPDIPSEKEVKENGVSLGEMQAKLLQKIEELTLYTIELNKTVKEQGEMIQELRSKLE